MPFRWAISEVDELVQVEGYDPIDLLAVVESIYEVLQSPAYAPHFRVLVDISKITSQLQPAEAVEIARVLNLTRPLLGGPIAIVAKGPVLALAKITAAIVSRHGLPLRAFRDPEDALAWLFPEPQAAAALAGG